MKNLSPLRSFRSRPVAPPSPTQSAACLCLEAPQVKLGSDYNVPATGGPAPILKVCKESALPRSSGPHQRTSTASTNAHQGLTQGRERKQFAVAPASSFGAVQESVSSIRTIPSSVKKNIETLQRSFIVPGAGISAGAGVKVRPNVVPKGGRPA